jgi:hypothetical protein
MFRPILGRHQRDKQYQHLKEMLYMASEGLHKLFTLKRSYSFICNRVTDQYE